MCLYLADYLLVFLMFPLVAARFAVYQGSYFREISLKGFRLFRKDGLGREVGGLVHCEKECLGSVKLCLGTVVEPEDSVDKDMRTDSAVDVTDVSATKSSDKKREVKPSLAVVPEKLFCSWETLQ